MEQESPAVPDTARLTRGINVARVLAIGFVLMPLLVLLITFVYASQVNPTATANPALYEAMQSYIYAAVLASCLLIPIVAFIGMRLTFRKRAITQQVERGRIFLSSLVVWVIYAFLTIALFILWNLTPGM
jgi:hypothetical protein